jgi:hypothetical protein
LRPEDLDWRILGPAAAALVLLAAGLAVWFWRRRGPDPAEAERRRRSYLNRIGRIVEGRILEIAEAPAEEIRGGGRRGKLAPPVTPVLPGNGKRTLVHYGYSISGVTYETAQDITGMEERACLEKLNSGQPVSVKYDPANPGNSILIADDWSGLH